MDALRVYLDLGDEPIAVGRLLLQQRTPYFRFMPDFIARGHNISPLKLAWTTEIQRADPEIFDGLIGVFADSLPDGRGRRCKLNRTPKHTA